MENLVLAQQIWEQRRSAELMTTEQFEAMKNHLEEIGTATITITSGAGEVFHFSTNANRRLDAWVPLWDFIRSVEAHLKFFD